jgi:CHAD domain-containing protein
VDDTSGTTSVRETDRKYESTGRWTPAWSPNSRPQADAIRATDPAIRRDVPDSVHAMWVACRRMRSTLRTFRTLLDRERTDAVVAELRWLAGELGGARDLEVQEERIGRAVATLPPEIALSPVAAQVTRFFGRLRPKAGATAFAALDGDRYLALLDTVDALLAAAPLTDAAADPARTELAALVGKALRRTSRPAPSAWRPTSTTPTRPCAPGPAR